MPEAGVTITSTREDEVLINKAATSRGVGGGGELTKREGVEGGTRGVVVEKDERGVGGMVGGYEGRIEKAVVRDLGEVTHIRENQALAGFQWEPPSEEGVVGGPEILKGCKGTKERAGGREEVSVGEATPIKGDDHLPADLSAGCDDIAVRNNVELCEVGEEGEQKNVKDEDASVERGGTNKGGEGVQAREKFVPGALENVDRRYVASD